MSCVIRTQTWIRYTFSAQGGLLSLSVLLLIVSGVERVYSSPDRQPLLAFDEVTKDIYSAEGNTVHRYSQGTKTNDTYAFNKSITILELIRTTEGSIYILCCFDTDQPSCSMRNIATLRDRRLDIIEKDFNTTSILMNPNGTRLVAEGPSRDTVFLSVSRNVKSNTHYTNRSALVIFVVNYKQFTLSTWYTADQKPVVMKVESTIFLDFLYEVYFNHSLFYVAKSFGHSRFKDKNILIFIDLPTGRRISTHAECVRNEEFLDATHFSDGDDANSETIVVTSNSRDRGKVLCVLPISEIQTYFLRIMQSANHLTTFEQRFCTPGFCAMIEPGMCHHIPEELAATTLQLRQATPFIQLNSASRAVSVTRVFNSAQAHILTADSKIIAVKLYNNSQVLSTFNLNGHNATGMFNFNNKLFISIPQRMIEYTDFTSCRRHLTVDGCLRDVSNCVTCQNDIDVTSKEIHSGSSSAFCVSTAICASPVDVILPVNVTAEVKPTWGPAGGGNLLTVMGDQLDLVKNFTVFIGNKTCDILKETVTRTRLLCVAPPCDRSLPAGFDVIVQHDAMSPSVIGRYEYTPDPTVVSYYPKHMIKSGGTTIHLESSELSSTHWPDLSVVILDTHGVPLSEYRDGYQCRQASDGVLCPLPQLRERSSYPSVTLALSLGATWDTPTEKGLIKTAQMAIEVRPDPVVEDFCAVLLFGSDIAIKGHNFDNVDQSQVKVHQFFENEPLKLRSINDTYITCSLKEDKNYEFLTVEIGTNLAYNPGGLYKEQTTSTTLEATTIFRTHEVTSHATTNPSLVSQENKAASTNYVAIIVSLVCACVLVAGILAMAIKRFLKKRKSKRLNMRQHSIVSYRGSLGDVFGDLATSRSISNVSVSDGLLAGGTNEVSKTIVKHLEHENLIIDLERLTLGKLLGRGNFGSVFKGVIQNEKESMDVAVKSLHHQDEPRKIDVQLFLKEAYVMKDFQHPNVMTLVGICLDLDEMPLVILPYMEHGDLLSYLHEDKHIPTVKDLVSFGLDIAKGMTYLAGLKFVHRDLAARNCMLDSNYNVKVADFGLSRDIYESSYYSARSKGTKLPVKWMAIDSLMNGVFNEKTDVWSFGVTLWELMTRGVRPYATVDNWEMERYLDSGRRLPQPMYCPNQLYKVMRRSWAPIPEDRPTFAELQTCISEMLERVHLQLGDADRTANIETTYVNLSKGASYYYANEAEFNQTT